MELIKMYSNCKPELLKKIIFWSWSPCAQSHPDATLRSNTCNKTLTCILKVIKHGGQLANLTGGRAAA